MSKKTKPDYIGDSGMVEKKDSLGRSVIIVSTIMIILMIALGISAIITLT